MRDPGRRVDIESSWMIDGRGERRREQRVDEDTRRTTNKKEDTLEMERTKSRWRWDRQLLQVEAPWGESGRRRRWFQWARLSVIWLQHSDAVFEARRGAFFSYNSEFCLLIFLLFLFFYICLALCRGQARREPQSHGQQMLRMLFTHCWVAPNQCRCGITKKTLCLEMGARITGVRTC